jgi:hypothetical protein
MLIIDMKKIIYTTLLVVTLVSTLGGLISLLPSEGASYTSLLGYKALCTFNPASALFCFFIAGTSCFIRSTFFKFENGTIREKIKKHIHSLVPLSLILLLAVGSTVWFITVNSQYDSITHVTEMTEG